jgi:phenylacetate-CoA ligase
MYGRIPLWAQQAAVNAYGGYWYWLRFGPGYSSYLKKYRSREGFNAIQWSAWQHHRLRALLEAAVSRVPYYRNAWNREARLAALAGRLQDLPLLEKEPIRADPRAFLRQDIRTPFPRTFYTSGSTGTSIATTWTPREVRKSLALREARSAQWAGVSFKLPRATFSGRMVEPNPDSRGPYYRFNAVERQVYLSVFHLRPDTAARYAEALNRHETQWLTGYASSCYLLATLVLEQRLVLPALKAVIVTSEKVTSDMRRIMQAAYRCPIHEEYSTVENAFFASQCSEGRLHVSPDAGIVEILRPDGTPCAAGEAGEVVATSFIRRYQPFIRYRIGDVAEWDVDGCPCGRAMPVLKEIVGRIEDAVVGPDGRQVVRFHGVFADQPHVKEAQVIQETLTRLRIRVVPSTGFDAADIDDIVRRTRQRLGWQVEVVVEPVSAIARTEAGKFRAVVARGRFTDQ